VYYNRPVPITRLIFDLDDTLYPANNGLWDELGQRINNFMIERVGIPPERVNETRRHYFQTYGTTLRGLMTNFPAMNPDDFLAYVHDVDLTPYLSPNPTLDAMLAALPQPKAIFTNANADHAHRVLACLGIARHFSAIVDIHAMNFDNKPLPGAYEALLNRIDAPAAECVLVEDSARNLRPAHELGMTTVLVGNGLDPDPAIHYRADTILEVGPIIETVISHQ